MAFSSVSPGQRRAAIVHGRHETVRVLEVVSEHPLCPGVRRLCKVESTDRLVLVSETDFGVIVGKYGR